MADERLFTIDEAQALLDGGVRELAERMVAVGREMEPLRARWRKIVLAVGSNGGGLSAEDAEQLRGRLEELSEQVQAAAEEIRGQGIQIKDIERGLLDFPAVIEGQDALLCWQVGEDRIGFWHGPQDGFAGRRPLP
jgi:hypothetical protein